MAYAYATTNLLSGLAAGAFTWSAGTGGATRSRLNDGWMDARYNNGDSASGITLVIDFGSAVSLSGIALLNHNAAVQKSDAAVRVRAATDAAISVSVITPKVATTLNTAVGLNKDHVLQWATSATKRYWELTFTWTGTVSQFSIGELYAFVAQTQLSRKSIYGSGDRPIIKTAEVEFYSGGSNSYFQGGPIRVKRMMFSDLNPTARAEMLAMWTATKGSATPLLWIESYEAVSTAAAVTEQEVVYGRLKQLEELDLPENDYQLYTPSEFVVESLAREIGS